MKRAIIAFTTIFTLLVSSLFVNAASPSTTSTSISIDPSKTISVTGGKITGTLSTDKTISVFKGIPFAAPPVGVLRWKSPQPVVAWSDIKKCVDYKASAIQAKQGPFMFWSSEFIIDTTKGYSEDCLYLNVWTKKESSNKSKPVVVYIHGGGNVSGGASCDVYDGEAIAKKDVVYVTINYRLGIFGFLASPQLSADSKDKISGNYALQDQIAALHWVKNNIAKFGGDPNNVTIAGQSAGSLNVHSLVASPMAKGLFKNAVAMSYNPLMTKLSTLKDKEAEGDKLFGDKNITDMRAMTTDDLLKLSAGFSASTCIDGKYVTGDTIDLYKSGKANNVNLITGMVDGDSFLFPVLSSGAPPFTSTISISKTKYEEAIKTQFGDLADECLAAYPATGDEAIDIYNQLNVDGAVAQQYFLAKARSLNSTNKTYIYEFSHPMPGIEAAKMGVFHTADVPYWINHFSIARDDYWAKVDFKLGDKMSNYLVNFAKTGNPNGTNVPTWTAFNASTISFNSLSDQVSFKTLSSDKAKFWQALYGAKLGF